LSFYVGEKVYQVIGVTGSGATLSNATMTAIVAVPGTTGIAYISNVQGTVSASTSNLYTIKGDTSNLEFYVRTKQAGTTLTIINHEDKSLQGDNDTISLEVKTTNLVNYSETDPFSNGKY
jgi:hypothetical protein